MNFTVAFAFIGVGLLLLLQAIQVLPPNHDTWQLIGEFWPLLLCVWGLEWSLPAFVRRRRGARLFPSLIFLAGALLLLINTGLLSVGHVNPLVLILALLLLFVGISILLHQASPAVTVNVRPGWVRVRPLRRRSHRARDFGQRSHSATYSRDQSEDAGETFEQGQQGSPDQASWSFRVAADGIDGVHVDGEWSRADAASAESSGDASDEGGAHFQFARTRRQAGLSLPVTFGEHRFGDEPWVLVPIRIANFFGEVRINLGTATIPEGTTTIDIDGGLGEVRLIVPEELPVDVSVHVGAGEINLFGTRRSGFIGRDGLHYADPEFAHAERRVAIRVRIYLGEVRLSRVM
ncbi:MAG: cell wall-active antibiotics response protein LiaF [Firmicutes bacterium]|nr:cell wall-active antibiotics response protein LiaF [Bacillota bacterium]